MGAEQSKLTRQRIRATARNPNGTRALMRGSEANAGTVTFNLRNEPEAGEAERPPKYSTEPPPSYEVACAANVESMHVTVAVSEISESESEEEEEDPPLPEVDSFLLVVPLWRWSNAQCRAWLRDVLVRKCERQDDAAAIMADVVLGRDKTGEWLNTAGVRFWISFLQTKDAGIVHWQLEKVKEDEFRVGLRAFYDGPELGNLADASTEAVTERATEEGDAREVSNRPELSAAACPESSSLATLTSSHVGD